MDIFLEYILHITPGFLLVVVLYFLLPKKALESKIFIFIFGFILMRDAMTPLGLWKVGASQHLIWIRFIDDSLILILLGIVSLLLTLIIVFRNPGIRDLIYWGNVKRIRTYIYGLLGALIICAPFLILYQYIPLADRGGVISYNLLLPICFIALCGNFMEETLFRGYAQGYFAKCSSPIKAAVLSGILFAVGHIFLASTVTDLGMVMLGFTLYEGLICAFVRMKHGVLSSTISHGMAIFMLSSGLF